MGEVVLKPCPFCGHAAVLLLHDSGGASVMCDRPLDHTGCCAVNPSSFADTAGEAAEAWNTRPLVDAQLTTLRARVERAEGALLEEQEAIRAEVCGFCEDLEDDSGGTLNPRWVDPPVNEFEQGFRRGWRLAAKSLRRGISDWIVARRALAARGE